MTVSGPWKSHEQRHSSSSFSIPPWPSRVERSSSGDSQNSGCAASLRESDTNTASQQLSPTFSWNSHLEDTT
jgi:hypothetical protein